MSVTVKDSNLYVNVLADAVEAAFTGQMALLGTGVVILRSQLPTTNNLGGRLQAGDTVQIPYFDSIGELDDVAESGALIPRRLTSTQETASLSRSGVAGEITSWAQLVAQAGDPYAELARQFVAAAMRRIDKGCITAAATTTLSYDATGLASPSISEDHVIAASEVWGDELDLNNGVALIVCHSVVRKKMRLLKDSTGRRLYQDGNPAQGTLPTFCGYPVMASDRLTASGTTYTSYLCKRGAIAAWYNGNPMIEADRDILAATDVTALNLYHVEHLYKRPGNGTKSGVVKLLTTES